MFGALRVAAPEVKNNAIQGPIYSENRKIKVAQINDSLK